jgi:hypothetical protein
MASFFTKLKAQLNPFDGGRTWASVNREEEERRRREAAARQQAKTPSQPMIISPQIANNPTLQAFANPEQANERFAAKKAQEQQAVDNAYQNLLSGNSMTPYKPELIAKANQRLQQDQDRAKAERISKQSVGDKVRNTAKSVAFGSGRFGIGLAQGAGGLYDILTPGKGSNRLSNWATDKAEKADEYVQRNDLNTKIYRGTQIGGELAAGILTAGGATAATKAPMVGKYVNKVDDAMNLIPGTGRVAGGTRAVGKELLSPEAMATEAYFANKSIGEDVARGVDMNASRFALEYGLAVPSAGISVGANKLINRALLRNADNAISPGSPGAVVDTPNRTPQTPPKTDIIPGQSTGVKIDAPTPSPRPQVDLPAPIRPDIPTPARPDIPQVRPPELQPPPRFDPIRQPEPIGRPVQQQLIPEEVVTPPVRPVSEAAEQVQKNIIEQPKAKPELPTAEKPAPVAKAEAEAMAAPRIVPVDETGKPVRAVDSSVPDKPASTQKAIEPGEGAELTVDNSTTFEDGTIKTPGRQFVSGEDGTAVKSTAKPKKTPQKDLPDASTGGVARTGEVGKSKGKYSKGQEYQKTSQKASRTQGERAAATTSYEKFTADVEKKGSISTKDRDTAIELQRRYQPGTSEHRKLGDIANKSGTEAAQTLATIERTIRRTAGSKQLTDRYANKLYKVLDEGQTVSKADFNKVAAKNDAFVSARDNYNKALETFNSNPTQANANAFVRAQNAMDQADVAAKFTEYDVAADIAGKSKNPKAKEVIGKLERDAGVYTMDFTDANLLSSTRVMLNNFLNTAGVGAEEALFGKMGARIARALTGTNIGGGSRAGRKLGVKIGDKNLLRDARLRQGAKENAVTKSLKNFTTTGNTLGERNIQGATYSGVYDHYLQGLKKAGYKGDELKRRTLVQTLADPDDIAQDYMKQALANNALASTSNVRSAKVETLLTNKFAEKMGGGKVAQNAAKVITRVTIGFPTVIARSAVGGAKRASLGTFSATQGVKAMLKGNPEQAAKYFKNSFKEAGSGATMFATGVALGAAGLISGAYPKDKDAQAEWRREGKSEFSIKIGSDWYNLPAALGVFALPFMLGANAGENISEGKQFTEDMFRDTAETFIKLSPVDSFTSTANMLVDWSRGRNVDNKVAQVGSSLVRTVTPLGSLVNQIGKAFDPTANDTTKGDMLAQFMAKVQDGIPGLTNKLPDREFEGRVIVNPSAISRMFGAVSTEQSGGVQKTQDIRKEIDESVSKLNEYGAFSDGVRNLLDDDKKSLLDKARDGKKLDESDIKDLMSSIVKGVTPTGDTQFLEKEQYDDNLAVLKVKRDILSADPTVTQATLDDYDTQIKRGEIYKKNRTPYQLVKDYREVGLEDWRKMGIPPGDKKHDPDWYDPELYEALWQLDQEMTKEGVSRGKRGKAKYYVKEAGSGSGGGRAKNLRSSTIRQLSASLLGGDSANRYVAIDKPKSYIPDLQLDNKAKTDLKKSITIKKGVQL